MSLLSMIPAPFFVMPLKLAVTKLRHITSKGELFRFCLKKRGAPPLTPPRFVMSSMLQFLITFMVFINFHHVSSSLIIFVVSFFHKLIISLLFTFYTMSNLCFSVSVFLSPSLSLCGLSFSSAYSIMHHHFYHVSFFFIIFDYLDDFSSFSSFLSVHHLSCFFASVFYRFTLKIMISHFFMIFHNSSQFLLHNRALV